jgi:hypothetical protein
MNTTFCYTTKQSNDEQWQRAMEYVSLVAELNYMTQVITAYFLPAPFDSLRNGLQGNEGQLRYLQQVNYPTSF